MVLRNREIEGFTQIFFHIESKIWINHKSFGLETHCMENRFPNDSVMSPS